MSAPRNRVPSRGRLAHGQALAEFALVVPIMLLLMLLAVDFGRLFFTYIEVNNAAREGAYYASAHAAEDPWDAAAFRSGAIGAALRESNVQVQGGAGTLDVSDPICFSPPAPATAIDCHAASQFAGGIGNQVRVSVNQPFTFLTPLVGELFGGQVTLAASATAPILNPLTLDILDAEDPPPAPTATPSPTASPSETPSLPPGATPTPTPSPTPVPTCRVPNFYHTHWNNPDALNTWHVVAGFTGTLTNNADTKKIQRQSLPAGSMVPCASSMSVSNN